MVSHDIYIREQLCLTLEKEITSDDRLIINELGCCQGAARIDVAVVTDELHGFEIKSEKDTLERLRFQTLAYDSVFNTITLVTTENHLKGLDSILPPWWGIWEATSTGTEVHFSKLRQAIPNPRRDAIQVASLLWKDETVNILKKLGVSGVRSNATRYDLWSLLIETVSISELTEIITEQLRERGSWRVGRQQRLNGDWLPPGAKSPGSRVKLSRSRSPVYIGHPN
jgi:hypothetical protein